MPELNYIVLNNQVGLDESNEVSVYDEAPDGFEDGDIAQAEAFIAWWNAQYDIDTDYMRTEVKYWDGRTLVVHFWDESALSVITFVFE